MEGKIYCDIVQLLSYGRRTERGVEGKILCDIVQLISYGRGIERGVEGKILYDIVQVLSYETDGVYHTWKVYQRWIRRWG